MFKFKNVLLITLPKTRLEKKTCFWLRTLLKDLNKFTRIKFFFILLVHRSAFIKTLLAMFILQCQLLPCKYFYKKGFCWFSGVQMKPHSKRKICFGRTISAPLHTLGQHFWALFCIWFSLHLVRKYLFSHISLKCQIVRLHVKFESSH